jgi:hypothetical protein
MSKDFAEIAHNVTSGATKWPIDVRRAPGTDWRTTTVSALKTMERSSKREHLPTQKNRNL